MAILFLHVYGFHAYSQKVELTSVPYWVTPIENPKESLVGKYDVNGGAFASLIDSQTNLITESDYMHISIDVLTDAGVSSASEISLSFDTVYQSLQFHFLYVWRDGKKTDRTERVSFEMLRQEQRLNVNMYTGLTTAYLLLDDVRKGDRVEYAYTTSGDNPIFEGNAYRMFNLIGYNPMDRYFIKVIMPANQVYECVHCEQMDIRTELDGEITILELDLLNLEAMEIEESIPSWHIPGPYMTVSTSNEWSDIGRWAHGVFDIPDESFEDIVKTICPDIKGLDEQIDALIDFVQDDIRYMGLENGLGSIRPFHPREVMAQRFGDCKDKSLLLSKLLEEVGVDMASPALVSTGMQTKLLDLTPGAQLFDHCITYFEVDGESFWCDPTRPMQGGGYRKLATTDFQVALIIEKADEGLVQMNVEDNLSMTRVSEHLDASSFDSDATLTIKTYYTGSDADYVRMLLERVSIRELENGLRGGYSILFPRIDSAERIQIKDNLKSNILTITEVYAVHDIWKEEVREGIPIYLLHYEPLKLFDYVSVLTCEKKDYPVEVSFPSRFEQQTTLLFPEYVSISAFKETRDNDAFRFEMLCFPVEGKELKIKYS